MGDRGTEEALSGDCSDGAMSGYVQALPEMGWWNHRGRDYGSGAGDERPVSASFHQLIKHMEGKASCQGVAASSSLNKSNVTMIACNEARDSSSTPALLIAVGPGCTPRAAHVPAPCFNHMPAVIL